MGKENKTDTCRHSLAHILAYAVSELYPAAPQGEPRLGRGIKFGIGPVIENGFYYDFDFSKGKSPSPEDLPKIEAKMRDLLKENFKFEKKSISADEAKELFKDQPYKLDLINELPEKEITIYESGKFIDLCSGPHIASVKEINSDAFRLTKIAGAYWKGSEKNPMLTRIYGLGFATKKELDDYLKMQEEAEKRDHRVLGQKLEFFMVDEKIGKGLPLWLPKGYFVRHMLEDYMYKTEREAGYLHVLTPILAKEDLYKTSGHLAHYKDDMYSPIEIEGEKYYLKPMNCPHHHSIYKNGTKSYKNLPLRIAEFGNVYRFERSGVLSGLIRTRGFTQNDAHIYAAPENLEKEIINILKLFKKVYNDFKISDYWFRLSLPDFNNAEKYGDIKNKEMWRMGQDILKNALEKMELKFEAVKGEATFYGPKIDIQIKNVYGKEDTIATIQVDYYSASKFSLSYIDKDGRKKPPVIVHRAILGSFERFFAFLLEKTAGAFPFWLSPVQIVIIPITDKQTKYAKAIKKELAGFRVEIKDAQETVGKKIREGEMQKIPYLLIIGDKEVKAKTVSVRTRGKGDEGQMKLKKFIEMVSRETNRK